MCPILHTPMTDPVTCPDGYTYERSALMRWLERSHTSPMIPGIRVTPDQVVPNRALLDVIEEAARTQAVDVSLTTTVEDVVYPTPKLHYAHSHTGKTDIVIRSPSAGSRLPRDVLLVVDQSGSMGTPLIIKTTEGTSERNGLTIWDITRHSVTTCIKALHPGDRATVVLFSDEAVLLGELRSMDAMNSDMLVARLETYSPSGRTNLAGGIKKALAVLEAREDTSREATIMVFTAGLPNIRPAFGELGELQRYKERHEGIPAIHTFGFGNNLDSALLRDIAILGQGGFGFIPDGAFLATIFVNAIANILSGYATHATVQSDSGQIEIGPLQYGQDRYLSLPGHVTPELLCSQGGICTSVRGEETEASGLPSSHILIHSLFVAGVKKCLMLCTSRMFDDAADTLQNTIAEIAKVTNDPYGEGLLADLNGQVKEAITPTYFSTWGRHWLRSNLRAHELQVCNNFKDPGVQGYGGQVFRDLQESTNQLFDSLPAPRPTGQADAGTVVLRSLAAYNNVSNPCFAGDCTVLMADNTVMRLDRLRKGHVVWTDQGHGTVRCILRTRCENGVARLVCFDNGLRVTEYHPISNPRSASGACDEDSWVHPCTLRKATNVRCPMVYSVLLDSGHTMMINGTTVICLGHGRTEGVLDHWFYGTNKVVEFLQSCPGWTDGLIDLGPECVERDDQGEFVALRMPTAEQSRRNAALMLKVAIEENETSLGGFPETPGDMVQPISRTQRCA